MGISQHTTHTNMLTYCPFFITLLVAFASLQVLATPADEELSIPGEATEATKLVGFSPFEPHFPGMRRDDGCVLKCTGTSVFCCPDLGTCCGNTETCCIGVGATCCSNGGCCAWDERCWPTRRGIRCCKKNKTCNTD